MTRKRIIGLILAIIASHLCLHAVWKNLSVIQDGSFPAFISRVLSSFSFHVALILLVPGIILIIIGKAVKKQPPAEIATQIKAQLPESPTPLTVRNLKKIQRMLPVPTDYEIMWAEVQSFGNHPAGVVITDRALILKAPKSEIKKQNQEIKKENKGKKKKDKKAKIPYVYRIIPWAYFSPNEYQFETVNTMKGKRYHLKIDDAALFQIDTPELFDTLTSMQRSYNDIRNALEDTEVASVYSAINTINVEPAVYMAKNGAGNTNTGHGIIAEDTGTILDKMHGTKATVVGRDNAYNGPDKLVTINGKSVPVQCKYYSSAKQSIDACFDNGKFRYIDLNDNPMRIEVPKEQYPEAISEMKTRIQNGEVPGVSDPNAAFEIVREGRITYAQARNIAKAGTIESITYDVATASVRCLSVFGISFMIVFAQILWETKDAKQAAKGALITGAKVYGLSIFGSIVSSQLARAGVANLFYPMMKSILDKMPDSFIQNLAKATKGVVRSEAAVVEASRNYYARFLSSQVASTCILFVVFSMPDVFHWVSSKMSTGQFAMNMAERFAGMAGGAISGSIVGGLVGTAVNPVVGGIAGFAAGTVGGIGTSFIVRQITHLFREDDNTIISRMFTAILINTVMDYLLSIQEQERLIKLLEQDKKRMMRLQKKLIKSESQARDIEKYLLPKIKIIIKERNQVKQLQERNIQMDINEIVEKGELCYEM